jgi:cell division protein FtsW
MKLRIFSRRRSGRPDYFLISAIGLLVIFGLVMLGSASSNLGKAKFGDAYYYLKHQLIYGLVLGVIGFAAGALVYYQRYKKFAFIMLIATITLLALVFTPLGVQAKGAARWLAFGPVVFQPAEIMKLFFIIYLASWLSRYAERQTSFRRGYIPFLIIIGTIAILLIKQPSTSTVIILASVALIMYFVSGAKIRYIFITAAVGAAALMLIVYVTPYRFLRVINFFPEDSLVGTMLLARCEKLPAEEQKQFCNRDAQSGQYHIEQARIAIGSGGLTGVGYGQSTTKISYLPEPAGDSIFAVIAEEFGFIGAATISLLFLAIVLRSFILAYRCRDKFGQLLLVGFGALIGIQAFMNIGAISGFIPLTGTPLPFISYGGTALAIFMTAGGILVNISKHS